MANGETGSPNLLRNST